MLSKEHQDCKEQQAVVQPVSIFEVFDQLKPKKRDLYANRNRIAMS